MSEIQQAPHGQDTPLAALREAAVQVLETMFFASLSGEEEPPPAGVLPAAHYNARIVFQGDRHGAFTIRVPDCMATTLAGNFLAEDEALIPLEQVEEVVRELTNMVCGATLSTVAPHATLDLSKPSMQSGIAPRGEVFSEAIAFDCGLLELRLEFWTTP